MADHSVFGGRYETILKVAYIGVIALFVSIDYRLFVGIRFGLWIVASILVFWVLSPLKSEEPPCGASHGSEHLAGNPREIHHEIHHH
jgi:hypothetical protein